MAKQIFELAEIPEVGVVPERMLAQLIRPERFGEPKDAFRIEEVPVPELAPHDVLVYVMAAGVNYNNVWAALGVPLERDQGSAEEAGEKEDFHIGGSDASGIVWKVGAEVTNAKVGDEVVVHCGYWDPNDPHVVAGKRSDARAHPEDLGLRDELGQLRAVHQGAGPPVPAQARAPVVGRGRGLHAGGRDRLSHVVRLAAPNVVRAPATRC
jgi:hypothetical protein